MEDEKDDSKLFTDFSIKCVENISNKTFREWLNTLSSTECIMLQTMREHEKSKLEAESKLTRVKDMLNNDIKEVENVLNTFKYVEQDFELKLYIAALKAVNGYAENLLKEFDEI